MQRRSFLGLILGAAAAPAIVKAESLMKIVVPSKKLILPGSVEWNACTNSLPLPEKLPTTRGLDIEQPTEADYEIKPSPFYYQWCRDGVPIKGATRKDYTPTPEDKHSIISIWWSDKPFIEL